MNSKRLTLIFGSRSHRSEMLLGFIWSILMSLGVLPAAGQQANQLQQQLEQLKQEYEATNQALQLRIATLEQQIESQKETGNNPKGRQSQRPELAAEHAVKDILGKLGAGRGEVSRPAATGTDV